MLKIISCFCLVLFERLFSLNYDSIVLFITTNHHCISVSLDRAIHIDILMGNPFFSLCLFFSRFVLFYDAVRFSRLALSNRHDDGGDDAISKTPNIKHISPITRNIHHWS